jgi:hypothetical protein
LTWTADLCRKASEDSGLAGCRHHEGTKAKFEATGLTRADAEREAVRRFGPATDLVRNSWGRSFSAMVGEIGRAAILLGGWGLVAVGVSGALAALMNALAGRRFVGEATVLDRPAPDRRLDDAQLDAVRLIPAAPASSPNPYRATSSQRISMASPPGIGRRGSRGAVNRDYSVRPSTHEVSRASSATR